jgi:pimeloyl-ACP methyl ester carboxylesterase
MATVEQAEDAHNVLRVNGVSLYYEEHGAGEPILGIHGTSSTAAAWADAVVDLATRGRTIVYDRRGSSRSERLEPYVTNVHEQADDAAALIDALAAAPAIVIGRSYGADIAIDFALRYPLHVRALVLLEGLESLTETGKRWLADVEERVLAAAEADMSTAAETLHRNVLGDAAWEGWPEPAKQTFAANGPAIVAELRGGPLDASAEQLRSIVQPTLLVAGKDSPPAFQEATNLTAAAMPSARVEWVVGGHLINPAHPAVLAFIDEVLDREEKP